MIDWKKEKVLEGDLVYLPANVKLVQTHNDGTVSRYTLTDKPMGVILTKKNEQRYVEQETSFCEVLYNSDRWLIHHRDIFKMRKE